MVEAPEQGHDNRRLEPGKWREETLMVAPFKLLIFACPKCGMRSPIKGDEKTWNGVFPWDCLDRKCKHSELVRLVGWKPRSLAGMENPGKAEASLGKD